jgi:hypothetical protein
MTIDRPMFPPRRENPLRLVGGIDASTALQQRRTAAAPPDVEPLPEVGYRDRECVRRAIAEHERARDAYAKAVAWLVAAEAENLPAANIEAARQELAVLYAEMQEAARRLIIVMPTDLKALVDLTMYLEINFSSLPDEIVRSSGSRSSFPKTESLAFHLLRTMRLSLRHVAKYGKLGSTE